MDNVIEIDKTKTVSGLNAPDDWTVIEVQYNKQEHHGFKWVRLFGSKMSVIEDIRVVEGKRWLHVSVGYPNDKMPSYEDMQIVRKLFIGEHRECYQVFPTKERYVNAHNVLHWWCCLDMPDGVLPHFEVMLSGKYTI